MVPWVLLLLSLPVLADVEKTHGVAPALLAKYAPATSGGAAKWTCLDGSKTLASSAVNDDYCDCPDGSDEPGTAACPNGSFYCRNGGHVSSFIPSTRVNDGLCEPECCDGSDEKPGVCPNKCREVGEAYREAQEAERKIRKKGSKIRSSYIAYAQKEKKRVESQIAALEQEVAVKEQEVTKLRDLAERAESLSAAALEHRKNSPLYKSLVEHSRALRSLQREHNKQLEREKTLGDILDALRVGYNPNYQDMAVLEAVRGWEALSGLPHINDVRKDEDLDAGAVSQQEVEVVLEEGMWSAEKLDRELDSLLRTDYETLLLQHDTHVDAPHFESVLFNLASYLPDSMIPQYEALRGSMVSWLQLLGIIEGQATGVNIDDSGARQAFQGAERALKDAIREKEKATEELDRIFDPEWYGTEGEWKKLSGTCIEKDTGDYTYEVCLFGEAKQKPNKGGASNTLGRFSSWNDAPGVEPGTAEYYSKQHYTRGAKCWNGPHRSVTLALSCGVENAILTVSEPEKLSEDVHQEL